MRIKLFENFGAKPVVLDSFQEAEGKLSNKTGIVLSLTGDITDIEEVIKDIPHKEAYVLITDQSSQVASSWKSDVFLVGAGETLTMASGTKNFPNFRELYNAMTIKQYFDEEWTDPAGGVHRGDDEDPAAMYENEIRARGVLNSKEDLVAFMKALVRGEVAQIVSSQSNIKVILADIGLDQIDAALDEIKKDVERLKKSA